MQDIKESVFNVFEGSSLVGNKLRGVVLFGSKKSKNNRIYSNRAIDDLRNLSEGNKAFLDHPGKQELKERGGVRSIRDWLGVFSSSRREGDKILANLTVRESYQPLIQDLIALQPGNVGFSINARVRVSQKNGTEVVENVGILRSVDLVSNAATTSNLFESAILESIGDDTEEAVRGFLFKEAIERFMNEVRGIPEQPNELFVKEEAVQEFLKDIGG